VSLLACVLPLINFSPPTRHWTELQVIGATATPDLKASVSPVQQNSATTPTREDQVVELRADLVTVTVTVATPTGQLITDLKSDDFEMLEDGVPQPITTFSRHLHLPLSLVVLFDTSLSIRTRLKFEKETLARFLRAIVRSIDQVAIISFNTDVTLDQPFTDNVNQLQSAIERLEAKGATALYDAVEAAASELRGQSKRRVILIMSDGRDIISRATLATALRAVQEADAVIYAINTSGRPASANVRELAGERALETLCDRTGGEVFFPESLEDLDPVFSRLADQLRTQYVLGFSPINETRDGSFRHLTVRVKRPNVFARAREGYYALKQ
jgi:Ca-activated chloride channel family protein